MLRLQKGQVNNTHACLNKVYGWKIHERSRIASYSIVSARSMLLSEWNIGPKLHNIHSKKIVINFGVNKFSVNTNLLREKKPNPTLTLCAIWVSSNQKRESEQHDGIFQSGGL